MVCSKCRSRMEAIRMLTEENERLKKEKAELELKESRAVGMLRMHFAHMEHLLQTWREDTGETEEMDSPDKLYG